MGVPRPLGVSPPGNIGSSDTTTWLAPRFHRIVNSNPPSVRDFTSHAALGIPPPDDDPETLRLWSGISAYRTMAQARRKARASPRLGAYIAVLEIPATGQVTYQRTTMSSGHDTLWGEATALLACVVDVVPLEVVQ